MTEAATTFLRTFFASVVKHSVVSASYPLNLASRAARGLVLFPLFLFSISVFSPEGMQGVLHGAAERRVGTAFVWGYVMYQFAIDGLWNVGYVIRREQMEGTLESLFLTPASRLTYLLSRIFHTQLISVLSVSLVLPVGLLLFGLPPQPQIGLALYAFACAQVGLIGVSIGLAAVALLRHEAAEPVAEVVQVVLITACAVLLPFAALPGPLRAIGSAIPLSYCIDLFRYALLGTSQGFPELSGVQREIYIAAFWALAAPLAGYALFCWADHRARLGGTLGQH